MNWMKRITGSALVATFLVAATAYGEGQKVTALLDDSVNVYSQKADYFVKVQSIASSALTLPAPVIAESDKGYVKVSQQGQDMWFDLADVKVFPPKGAGITGCIPTTYASVAKTGRGAGEGCP